MILFFGDTTADKPYRDSSGRPLAGATMTFWRSGTTAPATVYDEDGFKLKQPIVTDSDGVLPDVYLDPDITYRVKFEDSRERLLFDVDPYLTDSSLFRSPIYHARDNNERTLPGATLAFYEFNGTTPKDTYADGEGVAEHTNPVRADAGGFFPPIYLTTPDVPVDVYQVDPSFGDNFYEPAISARFVIVADGGDDGRIAYSDDGDEWENPDDPPDGTWNDVTYAPEIDTFFAVGDDNTIARSTDGGKTWEACDVPDADSDIIEDFTAVIWIPGAGDNEGRLVVGQTFSSSTVISDSFIYSDDGGETWTRTGDSLEITLHTYQFAYHDDILLAAGNYTSPGAHVAKSSDLGETWSAVNSMTLNGDEASGIVYSEILGTFVAGNNQGVVTSDLGVSWTSIDSQVILDRLYEFPEWERFFTINTNLLSSGDGETWSAVLNDPPNANLSSIASSPFNGVMIATAVAQAGAPDLIFRTENLDDWAAASDPPANADWSASVAGMAFVPGLELPVPPTPTITSLDPSSVTEDSGAFTLTVNGTDFLPSDHDDASVVQWGGEDRVTTYVSETELQAAILATDIADPDTVEVTVKNGDRVSDPADFTINDLVTLVVFTESDTWEVPAGVTEVDVLIVAGGGGGGMYNGFVNGAGGGGAGGVRVLTDYAVTPEDSITVVVGAGGAGGTSSTGKGGKGSDSSFDGQTATGGGGGQGFTSSAQPSDGGEDGGSGGGTAAFGFSPDWPGGDGVDGQGNDGGMAADAQANRPGAGGGGKSAAGGNTSGNGNGGDGGAGVTLASLGFSGAEAAPTAVGGGGGGGRNGGTAGSGGLGGGGAGGSAGAGTDGTANTGGGGGGSGGSTTAAGGAGGSGIVIVKY